MMHPRLSRVLAGLAVAASVAAGGGLLWLSSSLPPRDAGSVEAPVEAPVSLYRDAHGIAHIFAHDAADAAFALGYAHARDRLWQMESMRRLGSGRLSEILGRVTLETDRFMRTLGFAHLAEAQFAASSPGVRRILEAYANGVNGWRKRHNGALPPEFVALGFSPEPWRPADSLLWLRTMAMRLAENRNDELLHAALVARLPAELVFDLYPPAPPGDPLTIPGASPEAPVSFAMPHAGAGGGASRAASNLWAVGGGRTQSGKPLLANDPHLGLSAPIQWYLARIETPAGTRAGATAPGFPFHVFGHNSRIAWALTSTGSDVEDVFIERLDPADPRRYLTPEGSQPFIVRSETIGVRGAKPVAIEIRATRHGPVVSDAMASVPEGVGEDGDVLALAATYLAADDETPETALGVNTAGAWTEFVAALSHQKIIQQNFAYADIDGNIGFIAPGRVPIRLSGQGRLPAPGWTGEADWQGFIPFDELPRAYNPPAELIINANNRIVDDSYPWYLTGAWDPGFRARRIADLLAAAGPSSVASLAAMQTDTLSLMARMLLPKMLARMPGGGPHEAVLGALGRWSGEMAPDRPEPLIFSAWLRAFVRILTQRRLGPLFAAYWGYRPLFAARVLDARPMWCDDPATAEAEDCAKRLASALDEALHGLDADFGRDWRAWRWDEAHRARFDHRVLGRLPLIGVLFNVGVPIGGGNDTILRSASAIADPERPFAAIHGAGFRAVYDLADLDRSRFIVAPGQSGNPLSLHYRDLASLWRTGGSVALSRPRAELDAKPGDRLLFVPARARGVN